MKYQPGDEITWIDKTGVFGGEIGDTYTGIVTGSNTMWDGETAYYASRPEAPNTTYHIPEDLILKKDDYNDAWDRAMRGI